MYDTLEEAAAHADRAAQLHQRTIYAVAHNGRFMLMDEPPEGSELAYTATYTAPDTPA